MNLNAPKYGIITNLSTSPQGGAGTTGALSHRHRSAMGEPELKCVNNNVSKSNSYPPTAITESHALTRASEPEGSKLEHRRNTTRINNKSVPHCKDLSESQLRKRLLDLRPPQCNAAIHPVSSLTRPHEQTESVVEAAYRTMLDYRQPITLHRPLRADRQINQYDCLPSIKVTTEDHRRRRESLRDEMKQQLQREQESRKRRQMLELKREEELERAEEQRHVSQVSIFLPSSREYQFCKGDVSLATLPIPIMNEAPGKSTSSDKSPDQTSPDARTASASTRGFKRRHSASALVRRQKMIEVVSQWSVGMQPASSALSKTTSPPNQEPTLPPRHVYSGRSDSRIFGEMETERTNAAECND